MTQEGSRNCFGPQWWNCHCFSPKVAWESHLNSEAHPDLQPFASESLCDCSSCPHDTTMTIHIDVDYGNHIIIVENLFSQRYYSQIHD